MMLQDVCEVDFPPAVYGESLETIEATCSQVIERIFRDDDGMIRSGVSGRTMKPLAPEEVLDRPEGRGGGKESSAMPNHLKATWLTYEDACMASGRYLVALSEKFVATGDHDIAELARKTFHAIEQLWKNAAACSEGYGWMPKPYGGIHQLSGIHETSPDQYGDLTLGLEHYYDHVATSAERTTIEQMVTSFVDWWVNHDWTITYLGQTVRTHRHVRVHSVAIFLYITALAYRYRPLQRYEQAFAFWLERCEHLFIGKFKQSDVAGQALEAVARLVTLRPEHAHCWRRAVEVNAEHVSRCIEVEGDAVRQWADEAYGMNILHKAAHYLSVAHRILPDTGYGEKARLGIGHCHRREQFFHVGRGQKIEDLDPVVRGDDYRDIFYATDHASWLCAYWILRNSERNSA